MAAVQPGEAMVTHVGGSPVRYRFEIHDQFVRFFCGAKSFSMRSNGNVSSDAIQSLIQKAIGSGHLAHPRACSACAKCEHL